MLRIDHVALGAREPRAAAEWLAEILGLAAPRTEGADDDMFAVDLGDGASLLFATADPVPFQHMAFRVDAEAFAAIVGRLRARGLAHGNDPERPDNGLIEDPLGGAGRVYFASPDGHLFEATAP